MASKAYRERMLKRWRERREEMLPTLQQAGEALAARSERDKFIQQWRSTRARRILAAKDKGFRVS